MYKLLERYIHDNGYFPKKDDFTEYFLSHPNYPSLYSIKDTLTYFGIENFVIQLPVNPFCRAVSIKKLKTGCFASNLY